MKLLVGFGVETEAMAIRAARRVIQGPASKVMCFDTSVPTSVDNLARLAGQHAVSGAESCDGPVIAVVCSRSRKRCADSDVFKDAFIAWGVAQR